MDKYLISFSISLIGLFFLAFNTFHSLYLIDKIKTKTFSVFSIYLLTMLVIEICCHVLGFLDPGSNIFISHFYFNFQFLIITLFFAFLFKEIQKISRNIILISVVFLVIIACSYLLNSFSFWKFNTLEIGLTSFTIISYILYYFYYNFEKKNVKFTYFFSGLGIYLMSSSVIFLTGNIDLILIEEPFIDIWVFNSLLYILLQYFIYQELQIFKKKKLANE
ncbi:MAG: hypothetical protein A3G95_02080 [Flavobacteria bacterium RIFCSPLOWO2_12_FULL_31_7]|nr:MAG: hypothetical protein A3G95_02080 [Flavobacteria bacterium RIFCSPLOWO2_12_FULL_31_7]